MTTPSEEAPKPRKVAKIEPGEGGKLEQLLIEYEKARTLAASSAQEADELKAGIKAFLLDICGGDESLLPDSFQIPADAHGRFPGFSMTLKSGWRLATDEMKKEAPELYVTWARKTTPTWELRASQGGQGRRR